jgi:hypothetical protein
MTARSVGLVLGHRPEQLPRVRHGGDDLETAAGEQPGQPVPEHLPGQPGRGEQQPGRGETSNRPGPGGGVGRSQVGDRGRWSHPAGGHQPATGHSGEDRQQVEPELPPRRGGEPRPDRPRLPVRRPRARRDVQAERRAEPRPLQRAEPLHRPQRQHRARQDHRDVQGSVRPAAHRPVHQALDRGPPDQADPAEQDRADQRDEQAGQHVPGGPPGRCRPQGADRGPGPAGGQVCRGHNVTVQRRAARHHRAVLLRGWGDPHPGRPGTPATPRRASGSVVDMIEIRAPISGTHSARAAAAGHLPGRAPADEQAGRLRGPPG